MTRLKVDNLVFKFAAGFRASKYDDWSHPTPHGRKAVDVVATEKANPPDTLWLVEVKDFRVITQPPRPAHVTGLHAVVAKKVQDSLVGLESASMAAADAAEQDFALHAMKAPHRRVVLHLEPHTGPRSALFPVGFPSLVLQKLKPLVAAIDANPLVLDIASTSRASVPWGVS